MSSVNKIAPSTWFRDKSHNRTVNKIVPKSKKTPSRWTRVLLVLKLWMIAVPPRMKPKLKIFEPTILPTETSGISRNADIIARRNRLFDEHLDERLTHLLEARGDSVPSDLAKRVAKKTLGN